MPRYIDTKTKKIHRTRAGSYHDKRCAASKRYEPAPAKGSQPAKPETTPKPDGK